MSIWIPGGLKDGGGSSYVPPEWSSGTDEEIVEALEKHYNDEIDLTEYWSVGDERIVSLSSMAGLDYTDNQPVQDVTFVILNIGGKELVTPINGHTECAFIVGQKDCLKNPGCMQSSSNSSATSGWNSSDRRTWFNETSAQNYGYYNAIPSTLRSIFKQHYNYVSNYFSSTTPTQSADYFCLPSIVEVTGSNGSANSGAEANNFQLDYYKVSANQYKLMDNSGALYWTSSKRYDSFSGRNKYSFCYTGYSSGNDNQRIDHGFAPQGVI